MSVQDLANESVDSRDKTKSILRKVLAISANLILFLLAIDLMGSSFKLLGGDAAENILLVTSNPFIGLFIGLLMTAIIQSSSTSTSLMVTAVASGSLSVTSAIPMVMGANIGTTLTSTIVALGYITQKKEFRKAISAGTLHDIFNILVTIILLPLEYYYGFLSTLSQELVQLLAFNHTTSPGDSFSFRLWEILPFSKLLPTGNISPIILIIVAFALLMIAVKYLSRSLSSILIGQSRDRMQTYLFGSSKRSFIWGTLITAGVQSSSVTTSLIVPFVATGKVSLRNAAPFVMGANIGTTITAFIAASFRSEAAIALALAHLLFNLIGVILFSLPYLREVPIYLASQFGVLTNRVRLFGFLYIILTFFLLPFSLIKLSEQDTHSHLLRYQTTQGNLLVESKEFRDPRMNYWVEYAPGVAPAEFESAEPKRIYPVFHDGNIVVMMNNRFLEVQPGECWEGADERGTFTMCMEQEVEDDQFEEHLTKSSHAQLYIKTYHTHPTADSSRVSQELFWVSLSQKLILRYERKNSQGNVLFTQSLESIEVGD